VYSTLIDEWDGLFGNTKVKPIQRRVLDKAFYTQGYKNSSPESSQREIEYWKSYHISEETLKFSVLNQYIRY
jgi:hypothetical protein